MRLLILETNPRSVTLDGSLIAGPGGEGRLVAEFSVSRAALEDALLQMQLPINHPVGPQNAATSACKPDLGATGRKTPQQGLTGPL